MSIYIETIGYKSWQFILFLYIGVQEKRKLREVKKERPETIVLEK